MAECPDEDDVEITPGYKPPAEKALNEIISQDTEDESLQKYKQTLLGDVASAAGGEKTVIVKKLLCQVDGCEDIALDLTGDLSKLKSTPVVLKEGCKYKLKIEFEVKGDIVAGLRFNTVLKRAGIKVESMPYMVGSYGPKAEDQSYTSKEEEAPSGMMARGVYKAHSIFRDDDEKEYLKWEWAIEIKKK